MNLIKKLPLLIPLIVNTPDIQAKGHNDFSPQKEIISSTQDALGATLKNSHTQTYLFSQDNKDTIINLNDHTSIIHTKLSQMLTSFWKEKWLSIIRKHTLQEINILRNPGKPLKLNGKLNICAQNYADTMAQNIFISHIYQGKNVENRAWEAWYNTQYIAENISREYPTIEAFMISFKNSPVHRKNMENQAYTDVGIGIGMSKKWTPYIVLVFWKERKQ